jgi:hypothetical protein
MTQFDKIEREMETNLFDRTDYIEVIEICAH